MNLRGSKIFQMLLIVAALLVAMVSVSYILSLGQLRDSKTLTSLAAVIAVLPVAFYAAVKRPILFPFCLYVILVPFDELLGLSKFGTLTRLFAVLSGAAILLWVVRSRRFSPPPISLWGWLLLTSWMGLTVFWALDPVVALNHIFTFLQLLALYAALCLIDLKPSDLKQILSASVVGGVLAATYGAYYFHNSLGTIMKRLVLSNSEGDVIDPNHFAAALILPITIVTVAALTTRSIWLRALLLFVDIILFIGVYESGSRGTIVALGVVFAFLFIALRNRWQIAFVTGCCLAASLALPSSIWDRFSVAITTGGAGRTAIWHVGYEAFKKFWLLGAGAANFSLAYDRAYLDAFSHYAHWGRGSHNLIIATGVELGIIGLILTAFAWIAQFTMLNKIPQHSPLYTYRVIAQAATAGLLTASMFLDVMYTKYAWLTLAVGAVTCSVWRSEQRHRRPEASVAIDVLSTKQLSSIRDSTLIGFGHL